MGDAEPVAHGLGVIDVLTGAAGATALDGLAMIVQLERDPDHLGTGPGGERGDHAAVDAARHGNDDARGSQTVLGSVSEIEIRGHRRHLYSKFTLSG
jgi:hypothetical protein